MPGKLYEGYAHLLFINVNFIFSSQSFYRNEANAITETNNELNLLYLLNLYLHATIVSLNNSLQLAKNLFRYLYFYSDTGNRSHNHDNCYNSVAEVQPYHWLGITANKCLSILSNGSVQCDIYVDWGVYSPSKPFIRPTLVIADVNVSQRYFEIFLGNLNVCRACFKIERCLIVFQQI